MTAAAKKARKRIPSRPGRGKGRRRAGWLLVLALAAAGGYFIWKRYPAPQKKEAARLAPAKTQVPPLAEVLPVPAPTVRPQSVTVPSPPPQAIPVPATERAITPPRTTPAPPSPEVIPPHPTPVPMAISRGPGEEPSDVLTAQIALDRRGFSPGSIDGLWGNQTRQAILAFQQSADLPMNGELDAGTRRKLFSKESWWRDRVIAPTDLDQLALVPDTWVGKSAMKGLFHESLLERLAEETHAHPNLLRKLNPGVAWPTPQVGSRVRLPHPGRPPARGQAGFITIRLSNRTLQVFDRNARIIAHYPCSIASKVEKRPVGELRIEVLVEDPNYTFTPELFPESAEARTLKRKYILPPGPNNPVGVAWIGLNRPGYGIHGTPIPEKVGRTESHGCFRLANWNARDLLTLVQVGTPIHVVE